jgi:hypothetical protein
MPTPVITPETPLCGAKPKPTSVRTGPCKNPAMRNQKRCRIHGGMSPRARAKALRTDVNTKAELALKRMNITPVTDPLTELQKLAGEVLAWKNEIVRHIYKLKQIRSVNGLGIEQVRSEIILYERALDRSITVLSALAKLGIDERLATIEETQAQMLQAALFAALDAAGIPLDDTSTRRAVATAFTRHLNVVG